MKTNYSGRTTAYKHKHTKWQDGYGKNAVITNLEENPKYLTEGKLDWNKVPHEAKPAIQSGVIFEVQWSDCPVEVEEEVRKLWNDKDFGNDNYYYSWEMIEDEEIYPIIAEYLKSKGINKCLIHWWW